MKDIEIFLNERINSNKNLDLLKIFFTKEELSYLSKKSISIVGTNGKTSTANFIYKLLSRQDISSLIFTSPHLVSYQERIRSNKKEIKYIDYIESIEDFEKKNNIKLGYFETLFLIACRNFIDLDLDVFVIEAGIGGRLDTTSIINSSGVVLTNVGYDHQDILGDTLEEILYEKIHISNNIKTLVCGEISDNHKKYISNELNNISISFLDEHKDFPLENNDFRVMNIYLSAIAIEEILGKKINEVDFKSVHDEQLEGRFEIIDNNPVKIIDGAHNISGIKTFYKTLKNLNKDLNFDFYLGFKKGKNFEEILVFLSSKENVSLKLIENNSFYDQIDIQKLTDFLNEKQVNYEISSIKEFAASKKHSILLGSLYLIGEYKKEYK